MELQSENIQSYAKIARLEDVIKDLKAERFKCDDKKGALEKYSQNNSAGTN